nr:unnamed protein product [Callosobruchus chinensis]
MIFFRKILRLSRASLGKTTVGHLVNLLSNDLSKFDQTFILAHYCWVGPIQVAVGTYMLYREMQVAALIGIAFLVAIVPLQSKLILFNNNNNNKCLYCYAAIRRSLAQWLLICIGVSVYYLQANEILSRLTLLHDLIFQSYRSSNC